MRDHDKDSEYPITIDISDLKLDDMLNTTGDVTINLDNTYGTTTTYWAGDSISDITVTPSDGSFTVDINDYTTDTVNIDWIYNNMNIDPNEVEKMCDHYPGLEKVWRNFKSVYDMVKQDYEGKKKAGEIDDDIPF